MTREVSTCVITFGNPITTGTFRYWPIACNAVGQLYFRASPPFSLALYVVYPIILQMCLFSLLYMTIMANDKVLATYFSFSLTDEEPPVYNAKKRGIVGMSTEWLSVEDIAHELHVSEDTVRNWIRHKEKEKRLVAYKVGRDYRIKREDYNKFLETRRTEHDE